MDFWCFSKIALVAASLLSVQRAFSSPVTISGPANVEIRNISSQLPVKPRLVKYRDLVREGLAAALKQNPYQGDLVEIAIIRSEDDPAYIAMMTIRLDRYSATEEWQTQPDQGTGWSLVRKLAMVKNRLPLKNLEDITLDPEEACRVLASRGHPYHNVFFDIYIPRKAPGPLAPFERVWEFEAWIGSQTTILLLGDATRLLYIPGKTLVDNSTTEVRNLRY